MVRKVRVSLLPRPRLRTEHILPLLLPALHPLRLEVQRSYPVLRDLPAGSNYGLPLQVLHGHSERGLVQLGDP